MSAAWVTLHYGSLVELCVPRARLEANGIPTNVPDETIGMIDPFMRGSGTGFDYSLQVPESCLAEARLLLEAQTGGLEPAYAVELQPAGELHDFERSSSPLPVEDARDSRLRRARWAALYCGSAPYTLWVAAQTFWLPAFWRRRARELALDCGALVLALLQVVMMAGILVSVLS